MIPHVTDAIQEWVDRVSKINVDPNESGLEPQVCIIEVNCCLLWRSSMFKSLNSFFGFSWVVRSAISKVCRSSKHLGNFNFVLNARTFATSTSVLSHCKTVNTKQSQLRTVLKNSGVWAYRQMWYVDPSLDF